ncbi:MAG: hypothetical protein IKA05_01590 [Clostridia bacterium]|nr:hypothetical protein [Clostridia bacterium]
MANLANNAEYQNLLRLRQAIIGKAEAQKKVDETKEKINKMSFEMDPPSEIKVERNAQDLKFQFEAPFRDKARREADRVEKIKRAMWILLAIAVAVVGIWLTVISFKWQMGASISATMSNSYLGDTFTYREATGIYWFSVSFLLLILTVVSGFIGMANDWDDILGKTCMIVTIVAGILCVITYCVGFSGYASSVSGGFWKVITWFSSFLTIPLTFIRMIYPLVPLLALAATGTGVGFSIYFCANVDVSLAPLNLDYTSLYSSKEYKIALEKDRSETVIERARYEAEYNLELQKFHREKQILQDGLKKFQAIVNNCNSIINQSTFLHSSYKNVKTLNSILYYFEYNRADTIKEALNEQRHDQEMAQLKSQLSEMQRKHIEEMEVQRAAYERQMKELQNTMVAESEKATEAMNKQLSELQHELVEARYQADKNMERLIAAEREKLYQLKDIANNIRTW